MYGLLITIIKYQSGNNMKIKIPASKVMPSGAFSIYESRMDGKAWVIPAWIEVPTGTKQNDIELTGVAKIQKTTEHQFIVKGSTGKKYIVTLNEYGKPSCNCVGFGYHRNCRHINQVLGDKYNKQTKVNEKITRRSVMPV